MPGFGLGMGFGRRGGRLRNSLILNVELVTNGGFDTDTAWSKAAGETISGGVLNCNEAGAVAMAFQSIAFVANGTYRVVYTVAGYASGGVIPYFVGGTLRNGATRTANGTYSEDLVANTGNVLFRFSSTAAGFVGTIDNVSVKRIA